MGDEIQSRVSTRAVDKRLIQPVWYENRALLGCILDGAVGQRKSVPWKIGSEEDDFSEGAQPKGGED